MKLTNYIRDAFVRAVMDDVPSIDYTEAMRKVVLDDLVKNLPPKIKALYKDLTMRDWVNKGSVYYASMYFYGPSLDASIKLSDEIKQQVKALEVLKDEQQATRDTIRQKIKAVAYSVTMRKALVELLPEFEKYLPADNAAAIKTLPVVANVVADLVKAGWPKEKAE